MTACPFLKLKSASVSQAECSGQQPWGQWFFSTPTDAVTTQERKFPSSMQTDQWPVWTRYFHWSLLATLSLHYFISRRELGLSKITFTDINKRRSSKADCAHLQQNLASEMSTVTACQLQFMLLFFAAKRKVPPAPCMCNPSFACLCSSARFLPDTCICVCRSRFLVVLVSVKGFWRNWCTCLPRQPFDVPLPVPASVSIMFPKHRHRADSRSHLSAYSISCPSPIRIASSGVLIYVK